MKFRVTPTPFMWAFMEPLSSFVHHPGLIMLSYWPGLLQETSAPIQVANCYPVTMSHIFNPSSYLEGGWAPNVSESSQFGRMVLIDVHAYKPAFFNWYVRSTIVRYVRGTLGRVKTRCAKYRQYIAKSWTSLWSPIKSRWELGTKIDNLSRQKCIPRLFGVFKDQLKH